jgi:4-amino-4-deoxy-L-arabinose transferase-like glycosyltransferase
MNDKRIDFLLIVLLILIAFGLQFYFLNPPVISDQLDYFFNASSFFNKPLAITFRNLRLGLIIPTAVFIKIFGYSEAAYYTMSFIGIAALVAGTYLVARFLFSRTTAILSAMLIMAMPNLLWESGHLLPDIPAAGMAVLAFGLLAANCSGDGIKNKESANWINFGAGLLLGWAYLIREFALFVFPMVIILLWVRRRPFSDLLFIMLGAVLSASIEWIYCAYFYGNPFIRFISVQPRGTAGTINRDVYEIMTNLPRLINKSGGYIYNFLLFLSLAGNFYKSLKGSKENLFLFVWFVSGYSLLTLTGLLPLILDWPDKVLLRLHLFRYWIIIIPPLIIGGVAVLQDLLNYISDNFFTSLSEKKLPVTLIASLITAIAVAQSFQSLSTNKDTIRNGNDAYLEFRDYIKSNSNPSDLLWIERGFPRASERIVPIFLKTFFGKNLWEGSIKYLNNGESYPKLSQLHNGLIVTNTYYNKSRFFNYPDYLLNIPAEWPMVFKSVNGEVEIHRIIG